MMRVSLQRLAAGAVLLATTLVTPRVAPRPLEAAIVDQDEDGIPDGWEDDGVDVTLPSGAKRRLNLKAAGASSRHKDIFVWVAWMEDSTHSHKPAADTLKIVQDAFARAPIVNTDGQDGIRLHVMFSDKSTRHTTTIGTADAQLNYNWAEFQKVKDAQLPTELRGVFHFALFAHLLGNMGSRSGVSRGIGAYDFIVSLGGFDPNGVGTTQDQAGTFMHELGHNLSLQHGGTDDLTSKPNYLSVMNYSFQFDGLTMDGVPGHFDYSRFRLDLNETRLDRVLGITSDQAFEKYGSKMYCTCGDGTTSIDSVAKSIDWDCSARGFIPIDIVRRDVNDNCTEEQDLRGAEDWSRIKLIPASTGGGTSPGETANLHEMDLGMARKIRLPVVANVRVSEAQGAARVQWASIPLDRVLAYRVFRRSGNEPFVRVGSTDKSTFTDTSVKPGQSYVYAVSALVAERGADDPVYLDPERYSEFRTRVAPTRGAKWARTGAVVAPSPAGGQPAPWTPPRVLYQTPLSASATLK